jgi:hypothetical protein
VLELEAAKRHVIGKLNANATLLGLLPAGTGNTDPIYDHPAPQGSAYPLVTVLHLSNVHHHAGQTHVAGVEFRFLVRAVGPSASKVAVYALLDQIDVSLHQVGSTQGSGAWEVDSYRQAYRELGDLDHGKRIQEAGAIYSVWVRPIG